MSQPTIAQLTTELVDLVKTAPSIGTRGFSVFNVDEVDEMAPLVGYPMAGISYEGRTPKENSVKGVAKQKSVSYTTLQFMIIIAHSYTYGTTEDTKPVLTDLLDEVCEIVLGYSALNARPWQFVGESPLETELEGVIMYGQIWEIDKLTIGNT